MENNIYHRKNKIISRKNLAEKVGVGEGSIRTKLSKLKKNKIIKITQVGVSLTEKGKKFLDKHKIKIAPIDAKDIAVGKYTVAVFIKNKAHKIRYGIEQRDEAIKKWCNRCNNNNIQPWKTFCTRYNH